MRGSGGRARQEAEPDILRENMALQGGIAKMMCQKHRGRPLRDAIFGK
ncbi:hypothetical protein GJA_3451 [Janthinobacterium agaricidamnosum NBRC 102515 = DSM 9628]|uniref:Uncharacterized protein n=1 Tax=Janthinobacterium agaricidamnosum NBRC 102515 = DSM 9628 TaxID=1349767 RepID=W0V9Y2_9BURK|nr:hypothetical protein GJA_3451 [Janthinobacterium agaricidamnosum NBRC 102515 = DSM 9628]